MEQVLSNLSRQELEHIILTLDQTNHSLVQSTIDEYEELKGEIKVTAVEIEYDTLYLSLSPEQQSRLKRILERDGMIRIAECSEECDFCDRYHGAEISSGDVHYYQPVTGRMLEEKEELSQLLQEKLEAILDEDEDESKNEEDQDEDEDE